MNLPPNPTPSNLFQLGLSNSLRTLIWLVLLAWFLGAVGLGWLVKVSLVFVGLLFALPVVGFFALQWWLKRNVVQSACPVCGAEVTGLNGNPVSCGNCGEALQVLDGRIIRLADEGTIDVMAVDVVDVPSQTIEP